MFVVSVYALLPYLPPFLKGINLLCASPFTLFLWLLLALRRGNAILQLSFVLLDFLVAKIGLIVHLLALWLFCLPATKLGLANVFLWLGR